jgi:photosystem II stability/assembly factor-like uncharacterized protein
MYFLDAAHGWISMGFSGLLSPGRLLATVDGGQTWTWPPSTPPVSGRIYFSSLDDGWLISNWDDELWATHDGGQTWDKEIFPIPAGVLPDDRKRFSAAPTFTDDAHGYIAFEYVGQGDISHLAVYKTESHGKRWHLLSYSAVPQDTRFALPDTTLILPVHSAGDELATKAVPLDSPSLGVALATKQTVETFSFADSINGWARMMDGRLLSTQSGGSKWSDITPANERRAKPGRSFVLPTGNRGTDGKFK